MREIEFRAKGLRKNKWFCGDLLTRTQDGACLIVDYYNKDGVKYIEVNKNTIGQYTGLKDKNGKKIFEGDIVKYTRKDMYCPEASFHRKDLISLHIVCWSEEECGFYHEHYDLASHRIIGSGNLNFEDSRAKENIIEIVGNIYDNPELLKGEER